jgi:hypothetical protein
MKVYTGSSWVAAYISGTGYAALTGATFSGNVTVPNLLTSGNVDGRDVSADGTKLDGIEANADVTDTTNVVAALTAGTNVTIAADGTISSTDTDTTYSNATTSVAGLMSATDKTKLDGVETGATADQTAAEIRTLVESATDSNVFTDADHTKLNGIEASADVTDTTNVVAALTAGTNVTIAADGTISSTDTNTTYSNATTSAAGLMSASDKTKLDGVEAGATADQTKADIDALGINAATLDSLDSTQFLRSDAADTKTSGDLSFSDNVKAVFGSGSDMQIYHDGSNSIITEQGTGDLIVYTNGAAFQVDSSSGENMIYAARDAGVNLYHNNNVRIQSTNAGATITGTLTVDGLSLGDGEYAYFGAGNDLRVGHTGSASVIQETGTGDLYIDATNFQIRSGDGTETLATLNTNGSVDLYYNNAVKLQTTNTGIDLTGNINAVDNIYLGSALYHEGDTDTYTQFHAANQWRVVTGGTEMLEVNDSYLALGANSVAKVNTNSVSGSVAPDFYGNNIFVWTLTGNLTLSNPTTEVAGMSGLFVFIHSGAARTVSLGTDYETVGGAGLTLSGTAGATDVVPYTVSASGRILLGTPQLAFA